MAPVMEPVGYFKGELGGLIWLISFYFIFFYHAQPMGQENDSDHWQACQVPCQECFITVLNVFPTTTDKRLFIMD